MAGTSAMLNPAHLIANALGEELVHIYRDIFGERQPDYASVARTAAKLVVERIANSDALYHDSHHTVMVTLVGQAIFKGRILVERPREADWLHFTFALLCHDIGYLRGICPGDSEDVFVTDENAFGGSGNDIYPVRRFAGYYITSADGLNCPGDVPANPGNKNMWGHFVSYVVPSSGGTPDTNLCPFTSGNICVPVLVE